MLWFKFKKDSFITVLFLYLLTSLAVLAALKGEAGELIDPVFGLKKDAV